jgi:DNA gyrase subunit A
VQDCIDVRQFDDERCLLMATRNGIVKKTVLADYSRPKRGGIIAIKLEDGDALIDVVKVVPGDDVVLSTANGMSIRFCETDARAMGRNTMGVKGITLSGEDHVVGMVVAEADATLLTVCENGYGKRTPFGPGELEGDETEVESEAETEEQAVAELPADETPPDAAGEPGEIIPRGNMRYRRQKRGGKGLRDIKTTDRNGKVIGILSVHANDHVLMVSSGGKIQRIRAADVSQIGRNTQGVRIMTLDAEKLASIARIPAAVVE